jgi:hypothetical protein
MQEIVRRVARAEMAYLETKGEFGPQSAFCPEEGNGHASRCTSVTFGIQIVCINYA